MLFSNPPTVDKKSFSVLKKDVKSISAFLKKKMSMSSIENIDPKKAFVFGSNMLTPIECEMTGLKGLNLVTDKDSFKVLHFDEQDGDIYVSRKMNGKDRVLLNFSFQNEELSSVMKTSELIELKSLLKIIKVSLM